MTPSIKEIQAEVAAYYGLTILALKNSQRSRRITYPRMVAMWLSDKHTNASLRVIGRCFNKHHSSVSHAIDCITDFIAFDDELAADLRTIESKITGANS